jgi:hypothetical protein
MSKYIPGEEMGQFVCGDVLLVSLVASPIVQEEIAPDSRETVPTQGLIWWSENAASGIDVETAIQMCIQNRLNVT